MICVSELLGVFLVQVCGEVFVGKDLERESFCYEEDFSEVGQVGSELVEVGLAD